MKLQRIMARVLSVLLVVTWIFPSNAASANSISITQAGSKLSHDSYLTGYQPATAEEKEKAETSKLSLQEILPNRLAGERVGQHQGIKTKIDVVQDDETIVTQASAIRSDNVQADAVPLNSTQISSVAAVDNSTSKYFPKIGSQQGNSCAAFTTTYYQLSYMVGKTLDWNHHDVTGNKINVPSQTFSTKWSYNLTNEGTDGGTNFEKVYTLFTQSGAATLSNFVYSGNDPTTYTPWPTSASIWRDALKYKIAGYVPISCNEMGIAQPVTSNHDTDLENIKSALINGDVLTFATNIYNWRFKSIQGTNNQICYYVTNDNVAGGHAMAIVGYDDSIWVDINSDNIQQTGELGAFKIANSWGEYWENGGYVWLAYDALNQISSVPNFSVSSRAAAFWDNLTYDIVFNGLYTPSIVGEFKVSGCADRSQIFVNTGESPLYHNTLKTTSTNNVFNNNKGHIAFDGTTNAGDAVFAIDYTPLYNTDSINKQNWYLLFSNKLTNNSLEYFKLTDANGAPLTQFANKCYRQDAEFLSVELSTEAYDNRGSLHEGIYYIGNKAAGKYLETSGATVVQNSFGAKTAQQWKVTYNGNGYYTISPVGQTGKLHVENAIDGNGSGVNASGSDPSAAAQSWEIKANADGTYQVRPQLSTTRCLEISNSPNATTRLNPFAQTDIQKWTFEDVNTVNDGIYYIRNKAGETYLNAADSNVTGNGFAARAAQQWSVKYKGNGYYSVKPMVNQNQFLEVSGGIDSDFADVNLNTQNSQAAAQSWQFFKNTDGSYRIIPQSSTAKSLEITSTTDAYINTFSASDAQKWIFEDVNTIKDDIYYLKNKASGKYMETSAANDIKQNNYTGAAAQQWKFVYKGNGYYKLIPLYDINRLMDVSNAWDVDYNTVKTWTNSGYPTAQSWQLYRNTDGSYRIIPQLSATRCLEISGSSTAYLNSFSSADTQKWVIEDIGVVPPIYGSDDNDTIIGYNYNDSLNGRLGNDIIDGGSGNDVLNGGSGNDTYLFKAGDGSDTVVDTSGTNLIVLKGLLPADITAARVGSDLKITLNGRTDQIMVQAYFVSLNIQLQFENGTLWNTAEITAAAVNASLLYDWESQPVGTQNLNINNLLGDTTSWLCDVTVSAQTAGLAPGSGKSLSVYNKTGSAANCRVAVNLPSGGLQNTAGLRVWLAAPSVSVNAIIYFRGPNSMNYYTHSIPVSANGGWAVVDWSDEFYMSGPTEWKWTRVDSSVLQQATTVWVEFVNLPSGGMTYLDDMMKITSATSLYDWESQPAGTQNNNIQGLTLDTTTWWSTVSVSTVTTGLCYNSTKSLAVTNITAAAQNSKVAMNVSSAAMQNTTGMRVWLKTPGGASDARIWFIGPNNMKYYADKSVSASGGWVYINWTDLMYQDGPDAWVWTHPNYNMIKNTTQLWIEFTAQASGATAYLDDIVLYK